MPSDAVATPAHGTSLPGRDFTPADQILIAACRDSDRRPAMEAVPMSSEEWATLPSRAERHGVAAALAAALADRTDVPAPVVRAVAQSAHAGVVSALDGLAQLHRIARHFEIAGIPVVALKGPAFAQWLYGNAGARRFGDLDLLVHPADRLRATEALESIGYRLPQGMSTRAAEAIYGALGAWPLGAAGRRPVDLHWRPAHARFPSPLTAAHLLASSTCLALPGVRIRIPCPTHAALLTLLHAAKHLWGALEMIVAIAAIMRHPDVDWTNVRTLAQRAYAWNGCAAGLRLASDLLGAPPPRVLMGGWPSASNRIVEEALTALRLPAGEFPDRWRERRVHRASLDGSFARIRYDLSRLLAPTPLEWEWWRLPDSLTSLYVPLRLVRLAGAFVRGALGFESAPPRNQPHAQGSS